MSPHLAIAIRDIALSPGWSITSVVELALKGSKDEYWITAFAKRGGNAIVSADQDFLKREPQVNAVFDTGLRVIHLPPRWGQAKGYLQAAHLLQWWRRIEEKNSEMKPRECYRPPWNINETGTLDRVRIDFASAQKKRRKQNRARRKPSESKKK